MNNEEIKKDWKPALKTYYFRNLPGKVVALNEAVAFEQYSLHPKFYGSSDDLRVSGYNELEAIVKHLEEKVASPTPPIDKRKQIHTKDSGWQVKGGGVQPNVNKLVEELVAQKLKEYGIHNQKQEGQN